MVQNYFFSANKKNLTSTSTEASCEKRSSSQTTAFLGGGMWLYGVGLNLAAII